MLDPAIHKGHVFTVREKDRNVCNTPREKALGNNILWSRKKKRKENFPLHPARHTRCINERELSTVSRLRPVQRIEDMKKTKTIVKKLIS